MLIKECTSCVLCCFFCRRRFWPAPAPTPACVHPTGVICTHYGCHAYVLHMYLMQTLGCFFFTTPNSFSTEYFFQFLLLDELRFSSSAIPWPRGLASNKKLATFFGTHRFGSEASYPSPSPLVPAESVECWTLILPVWIVAPVSIIAELQSSLSSVPPDLVIGS